jgi:hypothetical protein
LLKSDLESDDPFLVSALAIPDSVEIDGALLSALSHVHLYGSCRLEKRLPLTPVLAVLAEQNDLVQLSLSGSALDDESLQLVRRMAGLVFLAINRTGVSNQTVAELRQALPFCRIYSDFGDFEPLAEEGSQGAGD